MTKSENHSKNSRRARLIAFYLPQFHPIPENDKWWGKGFTEWTNVAKAKPLFRGHHQPNLPADLGFYDLRIPETREAQAELAKRHGIEGFCYWHYWFSGKRILERPFNEVIETGKPDFPFCLAWANATWTGIWHGCPDRILIKQEYPGQKDHEAHFQALLTAFTDDRYITVDDKPVFVIFHPNEFPDPVEFTDTWRALAVQHGLKGLYLVGITSHDWLPRSAGYDACCVDYFSTVKWKLDHTGPLGLIKNLFPPIKRRPSIYHYQDVIRSAFHANIYPAYQHPCLIPNWDNTPRSGCNGVVYQNATPELFKRHLEDGLQLIRAQEPERKLLFIKSWNEWAEGNYLEPDQRHGKKHLQVLKDILLQ